MSAISHDYIETYIRGLIKENNGYIKEMEDYAVENNVPIIHKEVAQFLKVIIKSHNIKKILEAGTAIGYSSSIMAKAAGKDSKVTTIEINDDMYNISRENIEKLKLKDNIEVIKGDALEVLENITGEYDMIFLDASKGHYDEFLNKCLDKLKPNGLLISDNVLFRGMVATNDLVKRRKITIVKRMRKYLENISTSENLETSILPIGDGIALTCKTRSEKSE